MIPQLLAVLSAVLLLAAPAQAGWRYANWGMTLEELVEASDGMVLPLAEPQETAGGYLQLARAEFESDEVHFVVHFLFSVELGQLKRVVLLATDPSKVAQAYIGLEARYGEPYKVEIEPIESGESHIAKWRVPDANTRITFFAIGDHAGIEYAPVSEVDVSG